MPRRVLLAVFVGQGAVALLLLAGASLLETGSPMAMVTVLTELPPGRALDVLGSAAEVVAGVLAIAITVVAIVVELASNRYSHEITGLFLRDRWNLAVLALLVITALLCLWTATTLGVTPATASAPISFYLTLTLVSVSLLALLPYFGYVFRVHLAAQRDPAHSGKGTDRGASGARPAVDPCGGRAAGRGPQRPESG